MLRVKEINSVEELTDLRGVWSDLLNQTPGATFFQSLDWLETFWQFFGHNRRLRVLTIEENGTPVGLLPLAVSSESTRMGKVRVLGYPLNGWGSFYGPIGANHGALLEAGLHHVRNTPRDWDVLDFRWVDTIGVDGGQTAHALEKSGLTFDAQLWHSSAQVELDSGWDEYWRSRKSTWRSNVRRCERLLAREGNLEHVRYRPLGAARDDGNPRWDLYDACVELADRSWQGSSTSGTTLSHESVRNYLRAGHESAARAGAVDVNLLLLDGRPIAFAYNYHFRGWVYGVRSGFDAAASENGAGNVLMARMIEDGCRRGDRLIDLGPNYLECKRYWLTRLQPAYHYTHFNPARLRAQALRLKRIVKRWIGWTKTAEEAPLAV